MEFMCEVCGKSIFGTRDILGCKMICEECTAIYESESALPLENAD